MAALLLGAGQAGVLDDFEDVSAWKAAPSDGVSLNLSQAEGFRGRALRLDFDFHGGAGYAVARKELPFSLPDNYEISFRVRAEAPVNNFEVKLIDPSNENVWWVNKKSFQFPKEWTEVRLKKRHIQFAWGPAGGGEIRNVAAIEFAVTAGTGGKGYVLLDELTLRELPPPHPYDRTPRVTTTAEGISLDFLEEREYGGLVIDWGEGPHASNYEVQVSSDGSGWKTVYHVENGNGGKDYVFLPEKESRHLRLRFLEGSGVPKIDVKPLEFCSSPEAFFLAIAKDAPRGAYPRWLGNEQSYWTVVGAPGDTAEGLFNEDGMLETGKGGFSVEPFLEQDGRLITWNDVRSTQTLAEGYLPIPSVTWESGALALQITAYATGEPGASTLRAHYRLLNRGAAKARAKLVLAVRPFQVNPSWQFLGTPPGGVSSIREISIDDRTVTVNGEKRIVASVSPSASGAATFDEGSITETLAQGQLPERQRVSDSLGYASAAMAWDLAVPGGEAKTVELAIPLHEPSPPRSPSPTRTPVRPGEGEAGTRVGAPLSRGMGSADGRGDGGEGSLEGAIESWRSELDRFDIQLPAAPALVQTLKSNLAYILINQDGPAIQPGSRSYERSWIRDGALTSTALLRLGHADEVRSFLSWYAPYQFANGKVPCCVDSRGADPVPENDSHGELIHLAAQYFRFTKDREEIERLWPHVEGAVRYLDELRQQRRTPAYRTPEKLPYFGLLPESISHEGYSDKPVHSYWDDFFALRGLKDAAELARALDRNEQAESWAKMRDEFRADLLASIGRAIALHGVDYLPASVEKGDFDPTSTSIGIAPGGELNDLPQAPLRHTFERYYRESIARRDGQKEWEAYTPYELRTLRTLLRLGWPERAHELLDFFMKDRCPAAWNQWAEVVWRESRNPKFIGDMPHTWVGSEFIHSFLDLLAYVREEDGALVLGDGLLPAWNEVTVRGLRTEVGRVDFTVTPAGKGVRYRIAGSAVPPGGIVARWQGNEVVVRELPADVIVERDFKSVDRVLERFRERGAFPGGVLAVGNRQGLLHLHPFGRLTYDKDSPPVAADTIYDLASLTKVVATTTMAMILVDEGRLDLDRPVQSFLPDFQGAGKEAVTVRHLLTHSSGLPATAPLFKEIQGKAAYVERIQKMDLEVPPGSRSLYSDLGVILLGQILEQAACQPLETFLQEHVLGPLGMKETRYRPPPELRSRIAPTENDPWRGRLVQGEVHDENAFAMGGVAPHAGLFSTAGDLARFAQMLLNGGVFEGRRIVSRETIEFFTRKAGIPGSDRALGWDTKSAEGSSAGMLFSARSFGHTGFTGTSLWIDPERQLYVILLTNRVHPTRENNLIREARPAVADAVVRVLL